MAHVTQKRRERELLSKVSNYISEVNMHCPSILIHLEVTLCGRQDVKIKLLTSLHFKRMSWVENMYTSIEKKNLHSNRCKLLLL